MPRRSADTLRSAFERHKSEPNVTLDKYVRDQRIALGRAIADKTAIYLDKRFWILLRDVEHGSRSDEGLSALLTEIRRVVEAGAAFCPLSEVLVLGEEPMKKSRFSEEQMVAILREADQTPVPEVAKKHKVSAQATWAGQRY